MVRWALGFLVLAVIAAVFGFGGLAATSAGVAKTLFVVCLVFAVVTFVINLFAVKRVS